MGFPVVVVFVLGAVVVVTLILFGFYHLICLVEAMSARDNGDLVPIAAAKNTPAATNSPTPIQGFFPSANKLFSSCVRSKVQMPLFFEVQTSGQHVGTDPKILASLPVFFSSSVDLEEKPNSSLDQEENLESSACNSEFQDDEKGILPPKCGHRLHVQCIEKWFQLRSGCPLCRSSADAESPKDELI